MVQPIVFPGGPPNQPSQFACDADRIVPAGGALASHLLHPDAKPFQRTFRKAVSQGLYTGTREKPYQFVLGSFVVPNEMNLALQGFGIQPYRFDGVIPGDAVPLEDRRLSLCLGYDLTFSTAGRLGNISTELIPGDPNIQFTPAYPVSAVNNMVGFPALPTKSPNGESTINTPYGPIVLGNSPGTVMGTGVQSEQFVQTVGAGGALMAQTQDSKQGPSDMPFTYIVNEGESVALTVAAFAPVRIPLAFIEGTVTGYLLPKTSLVALLQRMRPCG